MPKFEQKSDINAPVDTIWSILTNPTQWPQWFPDVESVTDLAAVQTGSAFHWQSHGQTGTGTIANVTGKQQLAVSMQMKDHQATHTFRLGPHGGLLGGKGSTLDYALEFHAPGGAIGEFITGGNPGDLLKVKHTLEKIKELAEREAGHH